MRYVKKEFPENISDIEEEHDLSVILAHWAAEEAADLLPRPALVANTDAVLESKDVFIRIDRSSTSSMETPSSIYHRRRLSDLVRYHRPEPYPNSTRRASLSGRSQLP